MVIEGNYRTSQPAAKCCLAHCRRKATRRLVMRARSSGREKSWSVCLFHLEPVRELIADMLFRNEHGHLMELTVRGPYFIDWIEDS